jgi:hypothetical protein
VRFRDVTKSLQPEGPLEALPFRGILLLPCREVSPETRDAQSSGTNGAPADPPEALPRTGPLEYSSDEVLLGGFVFREECYRARPGVTFEGLEFLGVPEDPQDILSGIGFQDTLLLQGVIDVPAAGETLAMSLCRFGQAADTYRADYKRPGK